EVIRLVGIAVTRLGVHEVRFTGGEPVLRPGLVEIVAATAALAPRPNISLTTNGIGLDRLAGPLVAAGLDRVNVSLDTLSAERCGAPAQTWLVSGHPGPPKVGVIASVTRPFCAACDRTRLTADGQVRTCLFSQRETDLRGLLRAGAPDDEIARAWATAMFGKAAGHGIDDPAFLQPARPMSAIGG